MTKEALKLALEALKRATNYDPVIARAITAIKEALAQPEQEPVGQLLEDAFGRGQVMWFNKPKDESMLYTTPPQRTWVGLTDEEIADCAEKMEASDPTDSFWREFFRGIEAKLKELNT
jgi:hypothetical protein